MRFVLVGTAFPMRGGIAQYMALLYQTLKNAGHDVFVLSFKRQYPSFLFPGKTQNDEGRELIPIQSFPILDSINPFSWIRAFFWVKGIRPDSLVFKYWMPFFAPCYSVLGGLSRWLLGVRIIYVCDNIKPHEKKAGDNLLSRLGLRFVDGFITQSASVRHDLLSLRPDANWLDSPHPVYSIFPPAISKSDARKALGIQDKRVILYFGYIRPYKGVRYLIQAMRTLSRHMQVLCLICGEFYEGREEISDLIREADLGRAIRVYDQFIPNENVHQYFCAADLVVLPYVSATQSGVVQIAYHYNRPVLVTHVGGLPEVVVEGKTGYIVPPGDPEAISGAVIRYYKERNRIPFEKDIQREKQKYSWERMRDAVVQLSVKQPDFPLNS